MTECVRCGSHLDAVESDGHGEDGDRTARLYRCSHCDAGGAVVRAPDGSIANVAGPAVDATWGSRDWGDEANDIATEGVSAPLVADGGQRDG